jgi:hypothetical protein
MTGGAHSSRNIATARPADHAARIESSLALLSESRRLCRSTAAIIRETRLTIGRTLEMLATPQGTPPEIKARLLRIAASNERLHDLAEDQGEVTQSEDRADARETTKLSKKRSNAPKTQYHKLADMSPRPKCVSNARRHS